MSCAKSLTTYACWSTECSEQHRDLTVIASAGVFWSACVFQLPMLGTKTSAASTALAGPISFVALLAPQIARRLCGGIKVLC